MKKKRNQTFPTLALAAIAACVVAWGAAAQKRSAKVQKPWASAASPYASAVALPEPVVFAPGVISTGDFESHPAFTPDGRTLYFLKNNPAFTFWTIVVSHAQANGRWSTPEVAEFSGRYSDADPFITADGKKFLFISNRPLAGQPPDKFKGDLDIWMMEQTATGWSAPVNLGAPVNSGGNEWHPTLTEDGTLYFGSDREGGRGLTDLYRCRLVNGKYAEAENLGDAVNTRFNEFEPYIAPDESYLIFMGGRPGGKGGFDLYLSYRREGKWTEPKNLGDKINTPANEYSPKISPDGKYFFYTSGGLRGVWDEPPPRRLSYRELMSKLQSPQNGLGDIYQVDVSALKLER
jgi:Tol biopolymer transport system component